MHTPYQRLDSDFEDPSADSKPRFQHTNHRFRRVDETVKWLYAVALGIWVVVCVIHGFTAPAPVDSTTLNPVTCMPSTQGRRLSQWFHKGDRSATLRMVIVSIAAIVTVGATSLWLAKMFLRHCLRAPTKVVKGGVLGQLTVFALATLAGGLMIIFGGEQSQVVGRVITVIGAAFLIIFGIVYACAWRKLDFVASMIGTAAACVYENNAIIHICLLTMLIGCLTAGPCVMLLAWVVDFSVPFKVNPSVVSTTDADMGLCPDASGQHVACCIPDADHIPTMDLVLFGSGLFLFLWTLAIVGAVRVYSIGTFVHKWYFAAPGSLVIGIGQLRKSLVDNSGCIVVGGLVVAVTSFLRMLTRNRHLQVLMRYIDRIISWLTKYGLLYAAMTGQPFLDAASDSTSLLVRNLLDGVSVAYMTSLILSIHALAMSIGLAAVASGLASVVATVLALDAGQMAVAVGVGSFTWTFMLMLFTVGILVDTTDAAFICFAMDKDADQVTRPEVHASFATLQAPSGVLVEQPTGDLAYAPQQPRSVEMQT